MKNTVIVLKNEDISEQFAKKNWMLCNILQNTAVYSGNLEQSPINYNYSEDKRTIELIWISFCA